MRRWISVSSLRCGLACFMFTVFGVGWGFFSGGGFDAFEVLQLILAGPRFCFLYILIKINVKLWPVIWELSFYV